MDEEASVYRYCPACQRHELRWNFPLKTEDDPGQECEFCMAEEIAVHGMKRYQDRKRVGGPRPNDCPRRQNTEFD